MKLSKIKSPVKSGPIDRNLRRIQRGLRNTPDCICVAEDALYRHARAGPFCFQPLVLSLHASTRPFLAKL